jgi:hypothetical protein
VISPSSAYPAATLTHVPEPPAPFTQNVAGAASGDDILGTIERLAALHKSGVLSDQEFTAKKAELLARL